MGLFSFKNQDLPVVSELEITKYLGKWYEIARLPNFFEKDLIKVSAFYSMDSKNKLRVLNYGVDENTKEEKSINGWAKVKATGKLKVSFFRPFYSPYYILALDENYHYALVGTPSRKYLWILCREKELEESIIQKLLEKAMSLGFNISNVIRTRQY